MGNPDWGKLFQQGRCKALGVPWTEEELKARYELKIPAEFVRKGILTIEEYQAELGGIKKEDQNKPLHKMSKEELVALAEQLGLKVEDGTHRMTVISMITNLNKKSDLPDEDSKDKDLELESSAS